MKKIVVLLVVLLGCMPVTAFAQKQFDCLHARWADFLCGAKCLTLKDIYQLTYLDSCAHLVLMVLPDSCGHYGAFRQSWRYPPSGQTQISPLPRKVRASF